MSHEVTLQSFDLSRLDDRMQMDQLSANGGFQRTDTLAFLADAIAELRHPNSATDQTQREVVRQEIVSNGESFGRWFAYPWLRTLVQLPDQAEYLALRTFRDRELRTATEQRKLFHGVSIAAVGLSVGSNSVDTLVASGFGDHYILADPDVVSHANLNRMLADVTDVGTSKVENMSRRISLRDPYVRQTLVPEGVTEDNMASLFAHQPRVVLEGADNLFVKAQVREASRRAHVPLVMVTDVGYQALVDVERYDIDDATQPFGGRLEPGEFQALVAGQTPPDQLGGFVIKIVGMEHITPRIGASLRQLHTTIGGFPQLAIAGRVAGAAATAAVQRIVLGHELPSGRYTPEEIFELNQRLA